MTWRILIADDEGPARQRLRRLLARETDLELVAECGDGESALASLRATRPDIALLDLEMPGLDGLAVAREIPPAERPAIIFVTAHDQHALAAFGLHAIDYLLKPVSPARLRTALARAQLLRPRPDAAIANEAAPAAERGRRQRVLVRTSDRVIVVQADDIDWIESAGNYAVLHAHRDNHVLRDTLAELEARLARGQFLRVSRTAVVNLDRVRQVINGHEDGTLLLLADGTRVTITRPWREIRARLESG